MLRYATTMQTFFTLGDVENLPPWVSLRASNLAWLSVREIIGYCANPLR